MRIAHNVGFYQSLRSSQLPIAQHRPSVTQQKPRRSNIVAAASEGTGRASDDSEASRRSGEPSSSSSSSIPDSLPVIGADTDWREFRAKLVASSKANSTGAAQVPQEWAHPIPAPEKGCLLLAHPMMFQDSQQYFYKAAILLVEHNERGSAGLILNRASKYKMGQVTMTRPMREFDDCQLWIGGDVGESQVLLLHKQAGLEGSAEVVKGVHIGGIDAATRKVAGGELKATDFRWFTRYSGWGPGQLARECKSGVWFTAAASPDLFMHEPDEADVDGRDFYHRVLEMMGGDYAVLAQHMRKAAATKAEAEAQVAREVRDALDDVSRGAEGEGPAKA